VIAFRLGYCGCISMLERSFPAAYGEFDSLLPLRPRFPAEGSAGHACPFRAFASTGVRAGGSGGRFFSFFPRCFRPSRISGPRKDSIQVRLGAAFHHGGRFCCTRPQGIASLIGRRCVFHHQHWEAGGTWGGGTSIKYTHLVERIMLISKAEPPSLPQTNQSALAISAFCDN